MSVLVTVTTLKYFHRSMQGRTEVLRRTVCRITAGNKRTSISVRLLKSAASSWSMKTLNFSQYWTETMRPSSDSPASTRPAGDAQGGGRCQNMITWHAGRENLTPFRTQDIERKKFRMKCGILGRRGRWGKADHRGKVNYPPSCSCEKF